MVITVLDGAMGGELIRRGAAAGGGLWSAQALLEAPEAVVQLHQDYISAGARIIITNSYSTVPSYLGKSHLEDRYIELTRLSGQLARRSVDASQAFLNGELVRVAGCLPPLSESYRPDLVPAEMDALPIYESMVISLRDNVDLFLCETMSSGREALYAASMASAHGEGRPVMVSWTLSEVPGEGLRSGESISYAFSMLQDLAISGYLFNCTSPEAILEALSELKGLTEKPIGGYANRLNKVDPDWTLDNDIKTGLRNDMGIEYFVEMAGKFQAAGATMIGGCCGIGPEYIEALARSLASPPSGKTASSR